VSSPDFKKVYFEYQSDMVGQIQDLWSKLANISIKDVRLRKIWWGNFRIQPSTCNVMIYVLMSHECSHRTMLKYWKCCSKTAYYQDSFANVWVCAVQ
jgi:hypothetical protein